MRTVAICEGIALAWSILFNVYLWIRLRTNRKALTILLAMIALENSK